MSKFTTFTVFLLCFFSFLNAQLFQVGHVTVQPVDSARNRTITDTEIYYPAQTAGNNVAVASGVFPVLVFGHGFTITWSSYDYIWNYFVPRGYICVFPRTEGSLSPNHGNFGADLNFLARYMNQQNNVSSSIFFGKVKNKSAVMGHSMGGGSTYLAASNNNVFTTLVSFAAAETNPSAKSAAKLVNCPVLSLAGEEDCVTKPIEHQIPIFDSLASSIKYFVQLSGASHCNFTNGNATTCFSAEGFSCIGFGPFISRQDQNNRSIRLSEPWLDFWLKDQCSSWQIFQDTLQQYISNQYVSLNQQVGTPVMPSSQTPIITQNANTLSSTSAQNYQWFFQGNPIQNAVNQNYTPTQNGLYSVQITDNFGCTAFSASFNFTLTTISKDDHPYFEIFPNPTSGDFIFIKTELTFQTYYEITDLSGKNVSFGKVQNQKISLENIVNGSYILKLTCDNKSQVLKLMISK